MTIRTVPALRRAGALWALGLLCSMGTGPLWAQTGGVSTGGCEVFASGRLGSSDYLPSYQGGCKNGMAEGQGTATWRIRHAPDAAPVQWQGRFSQGVFLAEAQTVGAQRIPRNSHRVLLDLGPLSAPAGAQPGRLWAESQVDGKLPASACQPYSLQVSANGRLADDALAIAWLDKAYSRWLAICPQAPDALKGRNLGIKLHQGTDWKPDSYGNLPNAVVEASKYFRSPSNDQAQEWTSYRNTAAQQVAQTQREQSDKEELQANQERIRAFARQTGASQLVPLEALRNNPFRFGEQPILVALRLTAALTPTEAVVQPAKRDRGDWSRVLVRGPIADWDNQGRIAAVRVKGRSTDSDTEGAVVLELLQSQRCKAWDCEDYLYMPGRRWLSDERFTARSERDAYAFLKLAALE